MGKKRIAIIGEKPTRKIVKTGKEHGRITDIGAEALAEAEKIEEKTKKLEKEIISKQKIIQKAKKRAKKRGKKYLTVKKLVDPNKTYSLSEAVKLLKKVSFSKFPGSIDAHLILKKTGVKGEIEFPHPTGKKQNIRIADENLLKELEEEKINFTLLVATPEIMPKLMKYARLLGPKGLMPNPKAGTITDKPEELVKKLAGKTQFSSESKAPLLHISIGKIDAPENHLKENFQALINAVGRKNIKKAVLSPTMGPGIRINLSDLSETVS